jgi:hypothetical protein
MEIYLHSLLISALDGIYGQIYVLAIVYSGKEPYVSTEQKNPLLLPEIEP